MKAIFFKKICNVHLFLRERERESVCVCVCVCVCEWGRGRERGRRRIQSRLHAVSTEPHMGLEFMNREIMTGAQRLTDGATQAPLFFILFVCHLSHNNFKDF